MLYDENRLKAAKIEYLKALKYKKYEFPYLENRLAQIFLNEKDYKSVISLLKKTLDMFPDYVDTYMNLGEAYLNLKQYEKAEEMYKKADMYNPFLVDIHKKLAEIYKKLSKKSDYENETWNLNKLSSNF